MTWLSISLSISKSFFYSVEITKMLLDFNEFNVRFLKYCDEIKCTKNWSTLPRVEILLDRLKIIQWPSRKPWSRVKKGAEEYYYLRDLRSNMRVRETGVRIRMMEAEGTHVKGVGFGSIGLGFWWGSLWYGVLEEHVAIVRSNLGGPRFSIGWLTWVLTFWEFCIEMWWLSQLWMWG